MSLRPMDDEESPQRRGTTHNAGAFLGPNGTFPAAMHTLSDEVPQEPSELEIERRGAEASRPPRSLLEMFLGWVRGTPR